MKMIFKCEIDHENFPKNTYEMTTDAVSLQEILPLFREFLLGCGFIIEGDLDIIPFEDEYNEEKKEENIR